MVLRPESRGHLSVAAFAGLFGFCRTSGLYGALRAVSLFDWT